MDVARAAARTQRPTGRIALGRGDTGIGITFEHPEHVFEPFTQPDGSIMRRFGGTGLGLSIVRRLVDMMGGTLVVGSQPAQGSTVSVRLTLEIPPIQG